MKYTKKPVEIEAVQFIGQDVEGVRVNHPEIIRSIDEKLFYITGCDARDWLSVDKKEDGKYEALPFMEYEVKSSKKRELANLEHPLVKLYMECFGFTELKTSAYIDTLEGTMEVKLNDWVITGVKGERYPCKPDIFEMTYNKSRLDKNLKEHLPVECDKYKQPEKSYYSKCFAGALSALKNGHMVAREGWNGKGMFIVKQIPATIGLDIIPKMQSLPQSAKDHLVSKQMPISYANQMLIVNSEGRADSWVPSSSDIFAEDWYVFE